MQIDFNKTRERMSLIRITRWSIARGLPNATVRAVLSGKYPHVEGRQYLAIIEALRADGFLVETSDDHVESMAA